MHTLHFDPRQRLLIGFAALAVSLVLALVAAAPLAWITDPLESLGRAAGE